MEYRRKVHTENGMVFIVDDDEALRDCIADLVRETGLQACCFGSAEEFLQSYKPSGLDCLLLDVRMPGMGGLELLANLTEQDIGIPVIIVTGYGDIQMAVNALQLGAIDFIEKPFRAQRLWESIRKGLKASGDQASRRAQRKEVQTSLSELTPKEKHVVKLLLEGNSDKEIATVLEVSRRAIAFHRNAILEKLGFDSVVKMAATLAKLNIEL